MMKKFRGELIELLKVKAENMARERFRTSGFLLASALLLAGGVQAQIRKPAVQINPQQIRVARLTSFNALVLDTNGDGLDLGGRTRTSLATGEPLNLGWTKQNTSDSFLVIDATTIRLAGFDVKDRNGTPVNGHTLPRDGLRIRTPDGSETISVNGWQMLGLFDSNKDGQINSSDPVWPSLKLFTDANADGTIGNSEINSLSNSNVRAISLTGLGAAHSDQFGNTVVDGSFTRTDGSRGLISDVMFKRS